MAANDAPTEPFLDTIDGEIAFFRSIMRARPVGMHRHFHVLAMRNTIQRETGRWIPMEDIWRKIKECYDLDLLESLVRLFLQLSSTNILKAIGNGWL
jgi:MRG-binding protein